MGRLAALEQVKKLLATRLHGAPQRQPRGEGSRQRSTSTHATTRRRQIVEYLAQRGPRTGGDICRDLSIPTGSITGLLDHDWFQKSAQGVHITPLARREVLDA